MITKTEAIVLHTLKYGEQKVIVDMFTRVCGRLSFIVTIPKTGKGQMKKPYLQPLSLLEVSFDQRQQVQLQRLQNVRLLVPYVSVYSSPDKLSIALFIAEYLYYALRSEQRNEPLFDYIADSLQWLDAARGGGSELSPDVPHAPVEVSRVLSEVSGGW